MNLLIFVQESNVLKQVIFVQESNVWRNNSSYCINFQ